MAKKTKREPVAINLTSLDDLFEEAKNAPPLTEEEIQETLKIAKEAGLSLFFVPGRKDGSN